MESDRTTAPAEVKSQVLDLTTREARESLVSKVITQFQAANLLGEVEKRKQEELRLQLEQSELTGAFYQDRWGKSKGPIRFIPHKLAPKDNQKYREISRAISKLYDVKIKTIRTIMDAVLIPLPANAREVVLRELRKDKFWRDVVHLYDLSHGRRPEISEKDEGDQATQVVLEAVKALGEPSEREIIEHTGLPQPTVNRHLNGLQAMGLVERVGTRNKYRYRVAN